MFGKVVEGLDVVKRVEEVPTNEGDKPLTPVTIKDCGEVKAGSGGAEEPVKGKSGFFYPF